jgi:hypothetical protein
MTIQPWWTDPAWTRAVEEFQERRLKGQMKLTFDLGRLEEAFYEPLIYDHVDQVVMEETGDQIEGRRYVPRLMAAVFMRLYEMAGKPEEDVR